MQEPTDFKTIDNYTIYEGDKIVFKNEVFYEMCEVIKQDGEFYGFYEDENNENQYILMTEGFEYKF